MQLKLSRLFVCAHLAPSIQAIKGDVSPYMKEQEDMPTALYKLTRCIEAAQLPSLAQCIEGYVLGLETPMSLMKL